MFQDTFVKFWDLTTQHCFKTLTGHVTEIWDLVLLQEDRVLVTGGSDAELKVWRLEFQAPEEETELKYVTKEPRDKKGRTDGAEQDVKDGEPDREDDNSVLSIKRIGSILRSGEGRLQHLGTDRTNRVLATHGTDNTLELFLICNEEEIAKRIAKKAKKEKKRTGADVDVSTIKPTVQEQFRRIKPVKVSGKIKSIDVLCTKHQCRVAMVLGNNQLEVVGLRLEADGEAETLSKVESLGHRSDVRTLAFSSDNTAVLTASSEGVKVTEQTRLTQTSNLNLVKNLSYVFNFVFN